MNALVIGGGGREHALVWKLAQSPNVREVICAPGNAGTSRGKSRNTPIKADDLASLIAFAERERPDLTVVGPELPLTMGIVDRWPKGLRIWGPKAKQAELEGSKASAVTLCQQLGIPIPRSIICRHGSDAYHAISTFPNGRCVVKADGLAGGKGAKMCPSEMIAREEAAKMLAGSLGDAGRCLVIQEWLEGWETSLMVLCAGGQVIPLETAQDYKRIHDGDQGPNTGGMGAYSPVEHFTPELLAQTMETIVRPIVAATGFQGVLYVALMVTKDGPKVLEFNVRFGDPELQVVLPRLESDLYQILYEGAAGRFPTTELEWSTNACVCVVMASEGYPGKPRTGDVILGLEDLKKDRPRIIVFHAGTKLDENGRLVTSGGRVLNVVAMAASRPLAHADVYYATSYIVWRGEQHRHDIAA